MFHFAMFVSMCRDIVRAGTLYFIRDPNDPQFHPIREILERPTLHQLTKNWNQWNYLRNVDIHVFWNCY